MHEIIMPKLGLSMEKGTITQWFKNKNDEVKKGEILLEVEADKATLEVESYFNGYLLDIIVDEGNEVPVNTIIAYIGEKNEKVPESQSNSKEAVTINDNAAPELSNSEPEKAKPSGRQPSETNTRLKISPVAKMIAREEGIDLLTANIEGTGHNDKIRKKDIISYLSDNKNNKVKMNSNAELVIASANKLSGTRKIIAERLTESKTTIPHFVLTAKADVTALYKLRQKINESVLKAGKQKTTFTDFIIKASAAALDEYRYINSSLINSEHIIYESINIGMAVAAESGLVVPTIYNADSLSISEISKIRSNLIEKAKSNSLSISQLSNGTFSISNLGMFNISQFSAIINPPQGAILAVGKIFDSAEVIDGEIKARKCLNLSLSVDHRIIDGAEAAVFLDRLTEILETPEIFSIL